MQTPTPEAMPHLPTAWQWATGLLASIVIATPAAVQALIVLMAIDYATGIICALMACSLSSARGWRGLAAKTLTLLLVGTAQYVSRFMHLGFDAGAAVAMAFAANELISIVENCARAGVPIPEPLLVVVIRAKRLTGRTRSAAEVEEALSKEASAGGRSE